VDLFVIDVATLNPTTISGAFSDFFAREGSNLQSLAGDLGTDFQELQASIGRLFGVDDDSATAVAAATTATKSGATATSAGIRSRRRADSEAALWQWF
jgi:hypothetical protein